MSEQPAPHALSWPAADHPDHPQPTPAMYADGQRWSQAAPGEWVIVDDQGQVWP